MQLLKNIRDILIYQEKMGRKIDYSASYTAKDALRLIEDESDFVER